MAQWSMVVGAVLVVAVVVALVVPLFRQRRSGDAHSDAASDAVVVLGSRARSTKLMAAVATIVAAVVGLTSVVLALAVLLGGSADVDVPVRPFWPTLPEGVTVSGATATMHSAALTEAHLSVSDLSVGTRWFLAGGTLGHGVAVVAVALLVRTLCRSSLRSEPFTASLRGAGRRASIAVLLGGVIGGILGGIGLQGAASEALDFTEASGPSAVLEQDGVIGWLPQPAYGFSVDLLPIVVALIIAVFTQVVARGLELQRDRAKLERDTEGLV